MSKLMALVFDDPYKADEARAALLRMEGEGLCTVEESAVISKKEGDKIRVSQDVNVVENRHQTGKTIGIIAASLTGTLPLIGIGELAGYLIGRFTDNGVTNSFIKDIQKEPGSNTSTRASANRGERSFDRWVVQCASVSGLIVMRFGPTTRT